MYQNGSSIVGELREDIATEHIEGGLDLVTTFPPHFVIYLTGLCFACLCIALCVHSKTKKSPPPRDSNNDVATKEAPTLEICVDLDNANRASGSNFHPLERLLVEEGGGRFVFTLCADAEVAHYPHLSYELVLLLYSVGSTPHILESAIEIAASRINSSTHTLTVNSNTYPDNSNLFSPLLWRLMRKYACMVAQPFLKAALFSVLVKCDSFATNASVSPEEMHQLLAELVGNILDENVVLPKQVKRICRAIFTSVNRRLPNNHGMAVGSVGRFLFSGFVSSGLLAPHAFGLFKAPSPAFSRIMLQVAQALHHMGQGTLFGSSHLNLKSMNQPILEFTPRIQRYIEQMSKIEVLPQKYNSHIIVR